MLLELIGGYSLFLIFLFVYAEYFKKPALALIASILIFPLGAWVLGDGIQMQTGEMITISGDITGTSTLSGESEATTSGNDTSTEYNESSATSFYPDTTEIKGYMYADLPPTPYIEFSELIGLMCFLLGLYSTFHYALKTIPRT